MSASHAWAAAGLLTGLVVGSLFEWLVHAGMHRRLFLGRVHTQHHKDGTADGWVWEALYYLAGAVPGGALVVSAGWLAGGLWLTSGVAAGGVLYALFAGYAHQVQHERPDLVFWMPRPVHHLHHARQMWRANFGIGVDWWDRAFGTYQPVPWEPARGRRRLRDYVTVRWV